MSARIAGIFATFADYASNLSVISRLTNYLNYVFDSMTTAGDSEDLRYFLPRVLELLAEDRCGYLGPEVVLHKLGYAKWTTWPEAEREAIEFYLQELWRWARRAPQEVSTVHGGEMDSWLCGLARSGRDLGPYLLEWEEDESSAARANLEQFIENYWSAPGPGAYWEDEQTQWGRLQEWVEIASGLK